MGSTVLWAKSDIYRVSLLMILCQAQQASGAGTCSVPEGWFKVPLRRPHSAPGRRGAGQRSPGSNHPPWSKDKIPGSSHGHRRYHRYLTVVVIVVVVAVAVLTHSVRQLGLRTAISQPNHLPWSKDKIPGSSHRHRRYHRLW